MLTEFSDSFLELSYFAGRPIQLMSYEQALTLNVFPFFLKPYLIHKQFDAYVITQAADSSQPAAYAIDFGVEKYGRTLLVECNDFWSLDCYGLEPRLYVRGLITRWTEILGQKSVAR